jgi:hypothetical protein
MPKYKVQWSYRISANLYLVDAKSEEDVEALKYAGLRH